MLNPVCDRSGGKSIFTIVIPVQAGIPLSSFMDTPAWIQVVEHRLEQAAYVFSSFSNCSFLFNSGTILEAHQAMTAPPATITP